MKQMGLSYFTDIHLTVLALLIFFTVFAFFTFNIFRKSKKQFYDEMALSLIDDKASLPLNHKEINHGKR